jgi:hypothetical protein
LEIAVKKIKINETNEYRIEKSEYKGHEFVGIRKWYTKDNSEWFPSKDGITIKLELWNEFVRSVNEIVL